MTVEIVLVKTVNNKYLYFKTEFVRLSPNMVMQFNSSFNVGRGEADSSTITMGYLKTSPFYWSMYCIGLGCR